MELNFTEYDNYNDITTFVDDSNLNAYKIIFLLLCNFNNKIEINYLPVYKPTI